MKRVDFPLCFFALLCPLLFKWVMSFFGFFFSMVSQVSFFLNVQLCFTQMLNSDNPLNWRKRWFLPTSRCKFRVVRKVSVMDPGMNYWDYKYAVKLWIFFLYGLGKSTCSSNFCIVRMVSARHDCQHPLCFFLSILHMCTTIWGITAEWRQKCHFCPCGSPFTPLDICPWSSSSLRLLLHLYFFPPPGCQPDEPPTWKQTSREMRRKE